VLARFSLTPAASLDESRNTGDADLPRWFSWLQKLCPTTTSDSATVGRFVRVVGPEGVDEAREVAAGGLLMDAGPGT
jgi:hypothetical protein